MTFIMAGIFLLITKHAKHSRATIAAAAAARLRAPAMAVFYSGLELLSHDGGMLGLTVSYTSWHICPAVEARPQRSARNLLLI